ncbi:MAG: hypothetical protein SOT80_02915 [Candidatus Pseudoruminococcus sp.]|nr:hypothetical protein [Ruminococcus sp.]MDY2782338.1 hypothetical protein [Candidatus Pseudoruminococcus sp.]
MAVSAYSCFINTLDFSFLDYSDEAFDITKLFTVGLSVTRCVHQTFNHMNTFLICLT